MHNLLDIRSYLKAGISKTSFGEETDRLLEKFSADEKKNHIKFFHTMFRLSLRRLEVGSSLLGRNAALGTAGPWCPH